MITAKKTTLKKLRSFGFYFLLVLIMIWTLFPFLYMVISSFKTNVDLFNVDKLFIFKPTLKNYIDVFTLYDFAKPLKNTAIVTCISTVLCLLMGVPAAYSIARFDQRFFSTVILAVRIIPGIAFLVPWYVIFTKLGLNGTYVSLILCHMLIGLPMVVWVMIPCFEKLPRGLEESAMVDGATRMQAFSKIMMPLAVPGLITATLLTFIASWNNFIFGLILGTSKTQPLPVAIFSFISYTEVNWGGMMAASVVITLPIIVICMLLQKYIISGLTAGAVKG
jgi:multiple sugar transport system permease protein